jgi:phage terminase large subunit-like protein
MSIQKNNSLAESLALLPESEWRAWLADLSDKETAYLGYYWPFWARPAQVAPAGEWRVWLILAGRGFGKTRTGAEWVRQSVKNFPLTNVIAATADDARDIMIEGESGILAICPPDERPVYRSAYRRLEWPNGARTLIFTADEPERLRGKQHMRLWADEVAAWRYPEAWDQAMFGLRLGADPRAVVTTTPKPIEIVRRLVADPNCHVTRGSTYDNRGNLAPAFFEEIIKRYEGTRIGRQELNAEILDDVEGALWTRAMIDSTRVISHPDLVRIGIGVDPSGGATEGHDEQGIVAFGLGVDGDGYVLADKSCRLSPAGWGERVVQTFIAHNADRVFVEKNFGGDMAIATIEAAARAVNVFVPVVAVSASRGKVVRSEPIAAMYEQSRIHHVGPFKELEDQMCGWVPGETSQSPDRLDALVWAATEIMAQRTMSVTIL